MRIAPGAKSNFGPIWVCKSPKNLENFRGILSNRSRRSARSWLSRFFSHNAPSPMKMVCIYLRTSIFISQWDRDRTLTLPVTYGPVFWNSAFQRILSFKIKNFFPKIDQKSSKKLAGLRHAPPPYGAAPLPPTKVGAKCLAAVVQDNQDRALRLKSAVKRSQKVRLETRLEQSFPVEFFCCNLPLIWRLKAMGLALCGSYFAVIPILRLTRFDTQPNLL